MSGHALEVAAVGDRITHAWSLPDAKSLVTTAIELGVKAMSKKAGHGPVWSAILGKAAAELGGRAIEAIGDKPKCPRPSGEIEDGSPNTFVGPEARKVALADQAKVSCRRHKDKPIRQGSASVFVNNLPLARRTDETKCGARIGEGEPSVFAGKDTQDVLKADSALPAWLQSGVGAAVGIASGGSFDLAAASALGASIAGYAKAELATVEHALEGAVDEARALGMELEHRAEHLFEEAALRAAKFGQALSDGVASAAHSVLAAIGL